MRLLLVGGRLARSAAKRLAIRSIALRLCLICRCVTAVSLLLPPPRSMTAMVAPPKAHALLSQHVRQQSLCFTKSHIHLPFAVIPRLSLSSCRRKALSTHLLNHPQSRQPAPLPLVTLHAMSFLQCKEKDAFIARVLLPVRISCPCKRMRVSIHARAHNQTLPRIFVTLPNPTPVPTPLQLRPRPKSIFGLHLFV